MNNNKIISSEKIILEVPPDLSILKTYNNEQLISNCIQLNIPREQYESNNDEDKNRIFMINEILRLNPPIPKIEKPSLVNSIYDEHTMHKTNTLRYVKHIVEEGIYKYSLITLESYILPLTKKELDNENKEKFINNILNEIKQINIQDYINKEDILKFACKNGGTSGEKFKRAVILNKAVVHLRQHDKEFIRPRITHYDISVY